jgi:hypothetical protein
VSQELYDRFQEKIGEFGVDGAMGAVLRYLIKSFVDDRMTITSSKTVKCGEKHEQSASHLDKSETANPLDTFPL